MERIQFGTLSVLSCPVDKYMEKFFDSEEAPEQEIDVIEELVRIHGYDKIQIIEPKKSRTKPTLNNKQRLFHFLQRSFFD